MFLSVSAVAASYSASRVKEASSGIRLISTEYLAKARRTDQFKTRLSAGLK
jgi:hypothetical protein